MTVLIKLSDIPAGVQLSLDNAKALLKEANLLRKKNHYARSTALAILALEEIAKATFLRDRWLKRLDITSSIWENKITKHLPKARKAMEIYGQELTNPLKKKLNKKILNSFVRAVSSIAANSETIREACIYVNWDKGQWIDPNSGKYAQELVKPITLNSEDTAEALAVLTLHQTTLVLQNFENHPVSKKILASI